VRYFWSIIYASHILGISSGDEKGIKMIIVPVEGLENRIMKIIKSAILRCLNYSIQLWYPYYGNSELVYSHSTNPMHLSPELSGGSTRAHLNILYGCMFLQQFPT
jgi:hypothetical protein